MKPAIYRRIFKIKGDIRKFPLSELKRRYRKMVMIHHPDKGGDPDNFRIITEAFNYLKTFCLKDDPKPKKGKRKRYLYYSDGSIFDVKINRWIQVKGYKKWKVKLRKQRRKQKRSIR